MLNSPRAGITSTACSRDCTWQASPLSFVDLLRFIILINGPGDGQTRGKTACDTFAKRISGMVAIMVISLPTPLATQSNSHAISY